MKVPSNAIAALSAYVDARESAQCEYFNGLLTTRQYAERLLLLHRNTIDALLPTDDLLCATALGEVQGQARESISFVVDML